MTCEDFFDTYMVSRWDTLADEMYWSGGCDAELSFRVMKRLAAQARVELTNEDTFEYDSFFYQTYRDTEKGLS